MNCIAQAEINQNTERRFRLGASGKITEKTLVASVCFRTFTPAAPCHVASSAVSVWIALSPNDKHVDSLIPRGMKPSPLRQSSRASTNQFPSNDGSGQYFGATLIRVEGISTRNSTMFRRLRNTEQSLIASHVLITADANQAGK